MSTNAITQQRAIEQAVGKLDQAEFDRAARWVAKRLTAGNTAELRLAPNDGTEYAITVAGQHNVWVSYNGGEERTMYGRPGEYRVTLLNGFGDSYLWSPKNGRVYPDYAAGKWTREGHYWTGCVMARFLNTLRDELKLCEPLSPEVLAWATSTEVLTEVFGDES